MAQKLFLFLLSLEGTSTTKSIFSTPIYLQFLFGKVIFTILAKKIAQQFFEFLYLIEQIRLLGDAKS